MRLSENRTLAMKNVIYFVFRKHQAELEEYSLFWGCLKRQVKNIFQNVDPRDNIETAEDYSRNFNKVFCIGLHKTGTRSLHELFLNLGLRSTHNTCWDKGSLFKFVYWHYDCFSDGGGHFWNSELEFGGNHRVRLLDTSYPCSKFILTARNLESWLISKMIHAGWTPETEMIEKIPQRLEHDHWKLKSIDVIIQWIINRNKYHQRVLDYFGDRPNDLLIINLSKDKNCVQNVLTFLGIQRRPPAMPWEGRADTDKSHYKEIVKKAFLKMGLRESAWSKDI